MTLASAKNPPADWVALGVFAQPHGVSGRIKVRSLGDGPDDFAAHKNLTDERGNPVKLRITGHTQGMAVVEIEGIKDRNAAELLRGKKIGTIRAALPQPKKANQYYIHDLVGLSVVEAGGKPFGTVRNVVNYGASDILEIAQLDGKTELYAFTHATFPEVNIAKKIIQIVVPGVLE